MINKGVGYSLLFLVVITIFAYSSYSSARYDISARQDEITSSDFRREAELRQEVDIYRELELELKEKNNFLRGEIRKLTEESQERLFEKQRLERELELVKAKLGNRTNIRTEWGGGLLRKIEVTKRRYVRPPEDAVLMPGEDRRLLVFFVPIPADREKKRNLIRASYRLDMPPDVDMYFVVGRPKDGEEAIRLEYESQAWGDILVLEYPEGMDNGKIYHSFKLMHRLFGKNSTSPTRYDFVAKVDDDSLLIFPQFTDFIDTFSRNRTYLGWKHSE